MTQDHNHFKNPSDYERRDVSAWTVIAITLGSVLIIAITVVILYDYFISTKEAIIYEQVLSVESDTLAKLRARETLELNRYRLLDSASGTYQMPIEKAMQMVVDEATGTDPGQL